MEPFATKIVEWLQLKVQSKLALPVSMSEDSEEKKKEKVSNSLDQDQAQNLSGLMWVQTVCKGNQQTTKIAPSGQRVLQNNLLIFYFLAKTLAEISFIWLKRFPFG